LTKHYCLWRCFPIAYRKVRRTIANFRPKTCTKTRRHKIL